MAAVRRNRSGSAICRLAATWSRAPTGVPRCSSGRRPLRLEISEREKSGMPEYLAPGVFVEEVSFRQKTIEGVSTSTTGFVGPTRFGPLRGEPTLLTSFTEFERIYGGLDPLVFEDVGDVSVNYV